MFAVDYGAICLLVLNGMMIIILVSTRIFPIGMSVMLKIWKECFPIQDLTKIYPTGVIMYLNQYIIMTFLKDPVLSVLRIIPMKPGMIDADVKI